MVLLVIIHSMKKLITKSKDNHDVNKAQNIVFEKTVPPRKMQGYGEISTTKNLVLTEVEILKLLKDVRNENQYKLLTSSDKRIFDLIQRSYEKKCQGKSLEIIEFVIPKGEILEFSIIPKEKIARYIIYRYKYNLYSDLKIIEEYPPCVQLEVASICNFRCVMCYQIDKSFSSKSKGYMGYMDLDVFKNAIDELEGNVEAVTLASRGEPMLNPQISAMLDYMRGKFLGTKINTNASILSEKLIHELLSADLQTIVFSVDASDKETYEKIRINGNFEKVKGNIELFHKIKNRDYPDSRTVTRISGVKLNENQDLQKMIDMWRDLVDQVAFVHYLPWESSYENQINAINSPCSELWARMFVWWDGRMNPCDYDYKSTLTEKLNPTFPEQSISDFWNGDFYNSLRNTHLKNERYNIEPCARCNSI